MRELARILDASANRAREGLRVMEDVARFGLDDRSLVEELKGIRHGLADAVAGSGVDVGLLLATRDTAGDVGTTVKTAAEGARVGLSGIATAAAKRVGEALRSMEEAAKGAGGDWGAFEGLRYRVYEAERRLGLAIGCGRAEQWRVCVLVTESLCKRGWEDVVEGAIEGGAEAVQLREKGLESRGLLERARRLVEIVRGRAAVVINDRADIALLSGADATQVGQGDLSVSEVRRIAGAGMAVGVSTATMDEAWAAVRAGASYCGVGPMFETTTKKKERIAGAGYLRDYVGDALTGGVPHLAIGGIGVSNIDELLDAGVRGVAVSSAVCGAEDPAGVCRALRAAVERGVGVREGVEV